MNLDEDGNIATQKLDDGRICYVMPMTYGKARIGIGNKDMPLLFDAAY
jgi:hypothetical protein